MGIPVEIIDRGIDWPAWTQAIGSVLAILAAVGVNVFERRSSAAARQKESQAFVSLALGLAAQGRSLARDVQSDLEKPERSIAAANFDDVVDSLERLPFDKMPTAEFALAYVNVRRAVRFYGKHYQALLDMPSAPAAKVLDGGVRTELFNQAEAISLQYDRLVAEGAALGVDVVPAQANATHDAIRAHRRGRGLEP